MDIEVTASRARPTNTGVEGALDVDVTVTVDGVNHDGEVTLVRHEYDGRWSSWGQPDCWVCGSLLDQLRSLDSYRSVLAMIELEARDVCDGYEPESSEVAS